MIENEEPRPRDLYDIEQLLCRRVILIPIAVGHLGCRLSALVDEDVAFMALRGNRRWRRRVTGEHDDLVRRLNAITEGLLPLAMVDGERRDGNASVAVDDARLNLRDVHLGRRSALAITAASDTHTNIVRVCGDEVIDHRTRARRSVHIERFAAPRPGSEDQLRQPERVIRVKMREEDRAQVERVERPDVFSDRRCPPPHHTDAAVEQIDAAVDDDRRCWAIAIRIGRRAAGAECDDRGTAPRRASRDDADTLSALLRVAGSRGERGRGEHQHDPTFYKSVAANQRRHRHHLSAPCFMIKSV